MSENEVTEPIIILGDGVTIYDVYYSDPTTGLSIGTGDRFRSVMLNGVNEFGLVIAIQTMEPFKITAIMEYENPVHREFLPSDIAEAYPKPRGTR